MATEPLSRRVALARRSVPPRPADADLLKRFRTAGDRDAFEALLKRHGPAVLAACRKVLSDPADVDDAFQATFLTLLRSATAVRNPASVGGWLYGVAHRIAVQARLAALRRRRLEGRAPDRVVPSPPADDLSWREACAVLHEELDRLPDR